MRQIIGAAVNYPAQVRLWADRHGMVGDLSNYCVTHLVNAYDRDYEEACKVITEDDIYNFSVRTMDLSTSESRAQGRKDMVAYLQTHTAIDEKVQELKDSIIKLYS